MERVLTAIDEGVKRNQMDAHRLFHGRGQCYPGLEFINVDWYRPCLLITVYREPEPLQWQLFINGLQQFQGVFTCGLVQRRYLRGGPIETLWGEQDEAPLAYEQQLQFLLSFGSKQNIGFFLDMAPGRQWINQRAEGRRVLNLFSYTCSFSVAAIAGGARSVLNVDMSKAALDVGRRNHQLNNQGPRLQRDVQFLPYDMFRSWKKITNKGPYDLVIIDPPSRQKGSFVADKDYKRVLKRLPALMPHGGDVLACLNAPELPEQFLHQCFDEACPEACFIERLDNRVDFPELDTQKNLKLLHFTMPPQAPVI